MYILLLWIGFTKLNDVNCFWDIRGCQSNFCNDLQTIYSQCFNNGGFVSEGWECCETLRAAVRLRAPAEAVGETLGQVDLLLPPAHIAEALGLQVTLPWWKLCLDIKTDWSQQERGLDDQGGGDHGGDCLQLQGVD